MSSGAPLRHHSLFQHGSSYALVSTLLLRACTLLSSITPYSLPLHPFAPFLPMPPPHSPISFPPSTLLNTLSSPIPIVYFTVLTATSHTYVPQTSSPSVGPSTIAAHFNSTGVATHPIVEADLMMEMQQHPNTNLQIRYIGKQQSRDGLKQSLNASSMVSLSTNPVLLAAHQTRLCTQKFSTLKANTRRSKSNKPPSNKKPKRILTHGHKFFRDGRRLRPTLLLWLRKWCRPRSLRSILGGPGG
jgi:hypothetical protein